MIREASLYEKLEGDKVHCFLCSHHCIISVGKSGICGVRENSEGALYTQAYGQLIAQNVDPIEKKPLYHFFPGSSSFSIAAAGCNFQCGFCQNWQISQIKEAKRLGLHSDETRSEDVVKQALLTDSKSISFTYTEPTIFFEYAYEIARLAKNEGLYNVFVTNGFMTEEMISMMHPYLDAANIDLKSFSDDYYKKVCKGKLAPVLKNIELMKRLNIWVEITTLLVPGQNDSKEELKEIASFLSGIDRAIPWHVSRFYPQYKMDDLESTPIKSLQQAYEIGKEAGLHYIYLGNVEGKGNHTFCYHCQEVLIKRLGYSIQEYRIKEGRCLGCNNPIDGVGL